MINLFISFIGGILAYNLFPFFPVSIIIVCTLLAIFLILRASKTSELGSPTSRKILLGALMIFFFFSGFIYTHVKDENILKIELPHEEVQVEGTIMSVPEISYGKARWTLNNVSINGVPIKGKISLSAPPEVLSQDKPPAYRDRIRTFTRLKEPHLFLNFGVNSYDPRRDGIIARGYADRIEIVSEGSGVLAWLWKKRQLLARTMESSLSEQSAALHQAIVLGLKRGITPEMRDAFTTTGLAHLLAVSGTHFALLAIILFTVIKAIVKSLPMKILTRMTLYVTPTQIAIVLAMPVLVLYALISGASTPTARSLIMVFIYMSALFIGRKKQWLNSLSIAAIIILLWEPQSLFDLSFQLSFVAVLLIGYVLEKREDRTQGIPHHPPLVKVGLFEKTFEWMKISILITIVATLGTAPFVISYFHQFPLISPISNLIITPLVCFVVLPLGLFAGFLTLLTGINPLPLSYPIDVITSLSLNAIKIASNIPYSSLHLHKPSIMIATLFLLSLAIVIKCKSRWRLLPFVFIICLYILSPFLFVGPNPTITFLDVGQGDSAVVKLPDSPAHFFKWRAKKVMLIDGGSEVYDTGRRVIAPYLYSQGIRRVDYMVLSHPHSDHYGGFIYLIEHFKVGEVWWNGRKTPEVEEFFKKIAEKGIPLRTLKRGDMFESKDYKIYVLHPYDEFYAHSPRGETSNQNNDSLVLKIEWMDAKALFTGDIEMEAEEDLIYLSKWLRSDIIKVPHQGGRSSSTEGFLRAVSPQIAVISAGRGNPFNHPHRETLDRYRRLGAMVFRTDIDGAVMVTIGDGSYQIKTYHDSRFKEVTQWQDEIRNLRLLF